MVWFIHDDRFGRAYFESKAARDAAFIAAPYIDQKHWWLGKDGDAILRAWPDDGDC